MKEHAGLIASCFKWIVGSYKHAAILLFITIFGGGSVLLGVIIYQNPVEALQIIGERQLRAEMDASQFLKQVPELTAKVGANALFVYAVHLAGNQKGVLYASDKYSVYLGEHYVLYGTTANRLLLIDTIVGAVVCDKLRPENRLEDVLYAEGMRYVCLAPIPPDTGDFVGMFFAVFKTKPIQTYQFNRAFLDAAKVLTQ